MVNRPEITAGAETERFKPGAGPSGSGTRDRTRSRTANVLLWLVGVLAALAIAWTLRETVWVTMPIAFSFFLAIAVYPIDARVREKAPGRLKWAGHAAAMLVIVAAVALFLAGIWFAAQQVAEKLPSISNQLQSLVTLDGSQDTQEQRGTLQPGHASAGTEPQEQTGAGEQRNSERSQVGARSGIGGVLEAFRGGFGTTGSRVFELVSGYADTILSSAWRTVAIAVLIFFFTLLMLIEAPRWHDKLESASSRGAERATEASISAIAQRFRWYLVVRTVLGLITGALYAAWLWLFGVEFAFVFGLLAFLLNYIPTLGSLIAGILPTIFAFVTKDFGTAIAVAAGLLVIEQVMGNYVDPRVQGKQLSISPLVLLFALLFWGWVWGIAGALLAAPMMIFFVVTFTHVPRLKKVALFLSNERNFQGLEERARPT